jgi:3',5'-cyclic-AMP phosphodiesterase
MAYRLVWVTDPHLEFLRKESFMRTCFLGELFNEESDAILITGDVSNASNLESDLTALAQLNKPVHFVLGNHDYYGGTIGDSKNAAKITAETYPEKLIYLSDVGVIRLTDETCLVGVDGFADGLAGLGSQTTARINDFFQIEDLTRLPNDAARFALMFKMATEETADIRQKLVSAAAQAEKIIVATHVPAFSETSFHEGKIGDQHWLDPELTKRSRRRPQKRALIGFHEVARFRDERYSLLRTHRKNLTQAC